MATQQSTISRWGAIAISLVAGGWTVFHLIWNLVLKNTTDDYWGQALLVLFVLALILAFVRYFQERAALNASTAQDEFPEPAIAKFFLGSSGSAALWFVLRMNVGAQWLLAGWEKVRQRVWADERQRADGLCRGGLEGGERRESLRAGLVANFLQYWVLPHAASSRSW